jgi:hypothetical protein
MVPDGDGKGDRCGCDGAFEHATASARTTVGARRFPRSGLS